MPYIDVFFDESIFCSNGFTARECLRSISCSIVADYIHNVRKNLTMNDICKSINYFSKYLLDSTLPVNLHHMCCRILLALLDCIKSKQDTDNQWSPRELILKVLEIVVTKFKQISKTQVKYLLENNNELIQTQPSSDNLLSEEKCKEIFVIDEDLSDQLSNQDDAGQAQVRSQKKQEKLDSFLNSFDDKENSKVIKLLEVKL